MGLSEKFVPFLMVIPVAGELVRNVLLVPRFPILAEGLVLLWL